MKKCRECGANNLVKTVETLPFSDVADVEGVVYTCSNCGTRYQGFSRVEELGRAVANHIARRESRLSPQEIRYLRTFLGYSAKELASFLDVAPETVSRWESRKSPMLMQLSTEKLLRLMAMTEATSANFGLDRAGSTKKRSRKATFRERDGHWISERH